VACLPFGERWLPHPVGEGAILDYDVPTRANQSPETRNGVPIVPQDGPDAQQEDEIVLLFLPEPIPDVSPLETTPVGDTVLRRQRPRGLQKGREGVDALDPGAPLLSQGHGHRALAAGQIEHGRSLRDSD
jgi:hypothetical protein